MAHGPPVLEDDGVDRLQRGRVRREFVEVVEDDLLGRMSDVQAVEPEAARGSEEFGGVRRGQAEFVEVDDAVEAAQPLGPGFAFVQGRTQRPADAAADEADQP